MFWTYHVNMRLLQRKISRQMITDAVDSFEIIESYPDDKYHPSYLVWGCYGNRIFHVLFAVDVKMKNVRVITTYFPQPNKWESNFKQRRKL